MTDIKQIAIIVGIAVLFAALIGVGMETFYESPKYEKYCNQTFAYYPEAAGKIIPPTCNDVYSTPQSQQCYNEKGIPKLKYNSSNCPVYDGCDYCQKYFEAANEKHGQISFIILALVGIVAIIFGVYFKIEFIGSGFMYGGIITLFYATMRFLMEQNKYVRFIILFVELLIIIFIGYKKLYKKDKKK